MNILLIQPPVERMIQTCLPEAVEKNRGYSPPLGLLYLAAALRRSGFEKVEVLDAQAEELDYAGLEARLAASGADVIGISAMTFTLMDALECARRARKILPESRIVLGGAHAGLYPQPTLEHHPDIDFVLSGECERSLPLLIHSLAKGIEPLNVPGLAFRKDGGLHSNGEGDVIPDLDTLPFPARDLLPMDRYSSILSGHRLVTTMNSSRGCPLRCSFCYRAPHDRRFRSRSPANVVEEMEQCRAMGIGEIFFYDDTFNFDQERVHEICREILRRGLKIAWDARVRLDLLDLELLRLMNSAGCSRLWMGIETGSERIMRLIRKGIRLSQVPIAFDNARRAGISTLAYFMLGFPGETEAEMQATIRLALSLPSDYTHFSLVIPYPGTELYDHGRASGNIHGDPWMEFAVHPSPEFQPPRCVCAADPARVHAMLRTAYHAYYRRPSYVLKSILRLRSWRELNEKRKVAWKILFG